MTNHTVKDETERAPWWARVVLSAIGFRMAGQKFEAHLWRTLVLAGMVFMVIFTVHCQVRLEAKMDKIMDDSVTQSQANAWLLRFQTENRSLNVPEMPEKYRSPRQKQERQAALNNKKEPTP